MMIQIFYFFLFSLHDDTDDGVLVIVLFARLLIYCLLLFKTFIIYAAFIDTR